MTHTNQLIKMKVQIEEINSAGIKAQAKIDGIAEIEQLATGGEGDSKITIYQFGDARVADTNGDPVWEESVTSEDWAAMLAVAGIEFKSREIVFDDWHDFDKWLDVFYADGYHDRETLRHDLIYFVKCCMAQKFVMPLK